MITIISINFLQQVIIMGLYIFSPQLRKRLHVEYRLRDPALKSFYV